LELPAHGILWMQLERNVATTRHQKMDITIGRWMELFRRHGPSEKSRDIAVPRDNNFDVAWMSRLAAHALHRFRYPSRTAMRQRIREPNDASRPAEPSLAAHGWDSRRRQKRQWSWPDRRRSACKLSSSVFCVSLKFNSRLETGGPSKTTCVLR